MLMHYGEEPVSSLLGGAPFTRKRRKRKFPRANKGSAIPTGEKPIRRKLVEGSLKGKEGASNQKKRNEKLP